MHLLQQKLLNLGASVFLAMSISAVSAIELEWICRMKHSAEDPTSTLCFTHSTSLIPWTERLLAVQMH